MRYNSIKLIVGILLLVVGTINLANAEINNYPDVKSGECILLTQTCASCSYVNVSVILMQKNITLLDNVGMTSSGATWKYSFCNTTELGRYDVTGSGDLEGTDTGFDVLYFEVTSTGGNGSMFYLILITALAVIFLISTLIVDEEFFVYICGVLFLIGGVYLMINGLDVLNDSNTRYLSYIYLGIGILFTIGAYIYNGYSKYREEYYD